MKEGDIVRCLRQQVKAVSLKRATQKIGKMKNVDVARSPGSALRAFHSSERPANLLKINETGEAGRLVTKIEMDSPESRKLGEEERGWAVHKQEW